MKFLWIYLIIINIIAFAMFGADKRRARRRRWRIRVSLLMLVSLIGGALGGMIGMRVFNHKTRKKTFLTALPLMQIGRAHV